MQMKTGTLKQRESFSRGYDAGNYGNAYESTDWHRWSAKRLDDTTVEYRQGAILGFFSSYELHEIDDEECRALVETLRAKHGEE